MALLLCHGLRRRRLLVFGAGSPASECPYFYYIRAFVICINIAQIGKVFVQYIEAFSTTMFNNRVATLNLVERNVSSDEYLVLQLLP